MTGLPVFLPLSETQGYVLDEMLAGRGLCGWPTRVVSRLRSYGLIERVVTESPDVDGDGFGDRHRFTELGLQVATVAAEHRLSMGRRALGSGPVRGSRTRYGVNGRCSCREWKGYSNESAGKGGASDVRYAHARHLAEVLAAVSTGAA